MILTYKNGPWYAWHAELCVDMTHAIRWLDTEQLTYFVYDSPFHVVNGEAGGKVFKARAVKAYHMAPKIVIINPIPDADEEEDATLRWLMELACV